MKREGDLGWLIRLRWLAIAGQVVLIAGVQVLLSLDLPLGGLFAIVAVEVLTNLALTLARSRLAPLPRATTGAVLALDLLLLTALLHFSGGPFNPFTFLFLVHVSLAAVTLSRSGAWAIAALALAAYGALFLLDTRPAVGALPKEGSHALAGGIGHDPSHIVLHIRGMWVGFAVSAVFIVLFVQQVRAALQRRDRQLEVARARAARSERLAGLATLAAGAAHELATPLSTIAVVAKELERRLSDRDAEVEDVRLIRSEVKRCRQVLDHLAEDAGEWTGEALVEVPLNTWLESATRDLPVVIEGPPPAESFPIPQRALGRTLRGLVKNALDAGASTIRIHAEVTPTSLSIRVQDDGQGMPEEVLARARDPFFTTKPPGQGMGLGLFLAHALVERLGGELDLASKEGEGTTVSIQLPRTGGATSRRIEDAASGPQDTGP